MRKTTRVALGQAKNMINLANHRPETMAKLNKRSEKDLLLRNTDSISNSHSLSFEPSPLACDKGAHSFLTVFPTPAKLTLERRQGLPAF